MTGTAPSDFKEDDLPPAPEVEQEEPEGGTSVELSEEEAADLPPKEEPKAEADTGDGPRPKKKPRTNFNARIGQEVAKRTDAERRADALREELETLRGKHGEVEGAALHWGRQAVEREIKLLERELKDAKDGGDTAAEAALTNKMAEAHAQLARFPIAKPKEDEPKPEPKPAPRAREEEREEEIPAPLQAAPGTPKANWLGENTWFDPRTPEFDPAMAAYASKYATSLEQDLQARGRPDLISSDWYFRKINERMAQAFPEEYEMPEPAPKPPTNRGIPPMKQSNGAVSSPSRAPGNPSRTRIDLTEEEKNFALTLPRKVHQDGRPYTNEDMIKSFALSKADPARGAVRVTYTGRNGG